MPRGIPKSGFRKTKNWYRQHGLAAVRSVNKNVKDLIGVTVPGAQKAAIPDSPSDETEEQISQRISERFDILAGLTDSAICGDCRALIVTGPAGVGKSFMVEDKLFQVDPNMINWVSIKGKMSAVGLYKTLFSYREAGRIILIDDCDTVFFDEASLNLLKAACDTSEVRRLSWNTNAVLIDEETATPIPRRFEYHGTIIFISNYDFDYMIDRGTKLAPHLQALMSRAHYVDLTMKTARDCFIRIKQVLEMGLLKEKGLNSKQQQDVIDFIEENLSSLREISLRTALKIATLRVKPNMNNWKAVAKITNCRK